MKPIPALLPLLFFSVSALADDNGATADALYGPEAMAEARAALHHHAGGQNTYMVMADRLELQSGEGDPLALWDVQAWYGGHLEKGVLKSEGAFFLDGGNVEETTHQLLYSRAISPYFDLQAGIRQDIGPGPSPTYAVLGVQGMAPQWLELDAALFLNDDGDLTAKLEVETDLFLTQRLVLQPRMELGLSAQTIAKLETGDGVTDIGAGLRLRYEINRQFAPYVGVAWHSKLGRTADYVRLAGDTPTTVSFVTGLRLWF